jgi:mitogen-activated protein kinase 1/3
MKAGCSQPKGPLFPGKSCFPLSPDKMTHGRRSGSRISAHDQINIIFDVIGTPSDEDLEQLKNRNTRKYIRHFPKRESKNMS